MNKLITLGILTIFAFPLFSQVTEIGFLRAEVSIGVFSLNDEYIVGFEDNPNNYYYTPSTTTTTIGWETSDNSSPVFFADVSFFRYKKLEVGVNLGYQQLSTNKAFYGNPDPNTGIYPLETVTIDVFSFMPELRINWLTAADGKFEMYSGASFGLSFLNEEHSVNTSENESYKQPTIHVNGLGLRFGDKFGGFLELGFGARGFMSCGLSYRY
ncbi:hypothetical protein [Owenweeksia hongkongensis]|uniref:hypothetical protein n=1 Tax=Owenweeksia hongkongensis TaxID=253245 RepID=UPI003A941D14